MKKLIFASIFTAITSLVGCSDQETPSSTVENLFSAVEEGDAAGAAMYLTPEAAFWLPMMIAAAQEPGQAEIIKEEISEDGKSATVLIKNPNGKEDLLQLLKAEKGWKLTITVKMGQTADPSTGNAKEQPKNEKETIKTSAKLSQLFSAEMIGANATYFENIAGPARSTTDLSKYKINEYAIDECTIKAKISEGTIESLRASPLKNCNFDINQILQNAHGKLPSPQHLTFGAFEKALSKGTYMADCFKLCGNSLAPKIYNHWQGSRADGNINVLLDVDIIDNDAVNAHFAVGNVITQEMGEDWVINEQYNCNPDPLQDYARAAFEDIKVTGITIGANITTPECTVMVSRPQSLEEAISDEKSITCQYNESEYMCNVQDNLGYTTQMTPKEFAESQGHQIIYDSISFDDAKRSTTYLKMRVIE